MSTATYEECFRIEAASMPELASWLEMQADAGRFVLVRSHGTPLEQELQHAYGDALANVRGRLQIFEFKTETKPRTNLFMETYSNRRANRLGWLHTSRADWLCYYLRAQPEGPTLYVMSLPVVRDWLLTCGRRYPHVEQTRHEQPNDSWGLLVPIAHVRKAVNVAVWSPNGADWSRDDG